MKKLMPILLAGAVALVACGSSKGVSSSSESSAGRGQTITLLTHDSFAVTDSVLQKFESDTGITVNVSKGGDAGQVVNQAILTKDSPTADVLYGIDNTLLGRALDAGLFEPYASPALSSLDPALDLDPQQHRVTPIDESDVCVNFDKRSFGATGKPAAPKTLDDLTKPDYKDDLVVENPATSSTGLAFLLATVKRYGEDHYLDYWKQLKANGALVVDGWEQAYDEQFSAGGSAGGTKPLVVSYASSPPADVFYATPAKTDTDVGVVTDGCFQQIELAGVLHGTKHAAAAQQLIDFLASNAFQADMPLNMFVYPARTGTALPDLFTKYATKPTSTLTLDPALVASKRDTWIKDWTTAVTG
jgi:thiamine transport system substrate-binding protein